jgi:hypothetical protein
MNFIVFRYGYAFGCFDNEKDARKLAEAIDGCWVQDTYYDDKWKAWKNLEELENAISRNQS